MLDGEQFADFENTLVHDYYIRSDSSHLDISDIEARLCRDQKSASSGVAKEIRKASNELAKSLLSLLEKCDVVEFSRLVSNFRFPPTKVCPFYLFFVSQLLVAYVSYLDFRLTVRR